MKSLLLGLLVLSQPTWPAVHQDIAWGDGSATYCDLMRAWAPTAAWCIDFETTDGLCQTADPGLDRLDGESMTCNTTDMPPDSRTFAMEFPDTGTAADDSDPSGFSYGPFDEYCWHLRFKAPLSNYAGVTAFGIAGFASSNSLQVNFLTGTDDLQISCGAGAPVVIPMTGGSWHELDIHVDATGATPHEIEVELDNVFLAQTTCGVSNISAQDGMRFRDQDTVLPAPVQVDNFVVFSGDCH